MFLKSSRIKKVHQILKLDKPLIVFDLDTTGLAISADKIVKIVYQKVWPNEVMKKDEILLNPEIDIAPEATLIHGIKDVDTKDKPTFQERAQEIWDLFNGCYYVGFNIMNYDLPILKREFIRVGMEFEYSANEIVDAKRIFNYMVPRTLVSTYKYYCAKELKQTVQQLDRPELIVDILLKQLDDYRQAGSWEFINQIHENENDFRKDSSIQLYWQDGELHFAFSRHKNEKVLAVADSDPGFIEWVLEANIPEETKNTIKAVLKNKSK